MTPRCNISRQYQEPVVSEIARRKYICNIQAGKEIFKVMKTIGLGEREQQVAIHLRFTNGLPRHLQVSDEIVILASPACNLNDLHVVAWIICTDVGVYMLASPVKVVYQLSL